MKRSTYTILSVIVLTAGLAWIWASKAPPGSVSGGGIPAPQTGFQAPDFELTSLTGETYRLAELRGRPLLVNFWASWCTPCRSEMPAMERVYQQYREQGFLILAVNATGQDRMTNVGAFVAELGLSFPILLDQDGSITELYRVRALPSSFFIDERGTIKEVIIGGPMAEALLAIRVEQLLGGGG